MLYDSHHTCQSAACFFCMLIMSLGTVSILRRKNTREPRGLLATPMRASDARPRRVEQRRSSWCRRQRWCWSTTTWSAQHPAHPPSPPPHLPARVVLAPRVAAGVSPLSLPVWHLGCLATCFARSPTTRPRRVARAMRCAESGRLQMRILESVVYKDEQNIRYTERPAHIQARRALPRCVSGIILGGGHGGWLIPRSRYLYVLITQAAPWPPYL